MNFDEIKDKLHECCFLKCLKFYSPMPHEILTTLKSNTSVINL